jgi:toxin ParE1/3/4
LKRRKVVIAPEALHDLLDLYDWIAHRTEAEIAASYLARIEAFCLGFDVASERGQLRDDIRPGLRVIGFERRITVAFTTDEQQVTVLRLFYGGQDWETKL